MEFSGVPDEEVFGVWLAAMEELRLRGLVRTANNPVGDYAEALVAQRLGLELAGGSTAAYDARDRDGVRYQIKSRRLTSANLSRQLGALRNLDQDGFDYLIVVLFDEDFTLNGIWRLPISLVRERATYRKHVHAHVLIARDSVLNDPRAERLA